MSKDKYKVKNWSSYNEGLKKRGSLCLWIETGVAEHWQHTPTEKKRGAQKEYSDTAIELCLTIRKIYHLPLRQTEGFMESFFRLTKVDVKVPHYSVICRRSQSLKVDLCTSGNRPVTDIVVDSTGLKVYGEGEWKVRKHGVGKHRTWMKLHVAVDEQTQQIEAVTLTTNAVDDAAEVDSLLKQIKKPVGSLKGDGAYDKKKVRKRLKADNIEQVIPPQHNAVISDGKHDYLDKRDQDLADIARIGRAAWKVESNYHQRSKSETTMFRYKTIIGDKLSSRIKENQLTEVRIGCKILNITLQTTKPMSVKVA